MGGCVSPWPLHPPAGRVVPLQQVKAEAPKRVVYRSLEDTAPRCGPTGLTPMSRGSASVGHIDVVRRAVNYDL